VLRPAQDLPHHLYALCLLSKKMSCINAVRYCDTAIMQVILYKIMILYNLCSKRCNQVVACQLCPCCWTADALLGRITKHQPCIICRATDNEEVHWSGELVESLHGRCSHATPCLCPGQHNFHSLLYYVPYPAASRSWHIIHSAKW
jgi:hypothetical protein